MKQIISVSIPRSGHHLLMEILQGYFYWGQFLYCESYGYADCCRKFPCTAVSGRAVGAFGHDRNLCLYAQKSHDLQYEVPLSRRQSYIVQLRDPAQSAIGWIRWKVSQGGQISYGRVGYDVFNFLTYYIRFFHKWCIRPELDTCLIYYEDLTASRDRMAAQLERLVEWTGFEFDPSRMDSTLDRVLGTDAHTGVSRIFESKLYTMNYYNSLNGDSFVYMLHKVSQLCPGLQLTQPYPEIENDERRTAFDDLFYVLRFERQQSIVIDFTSKPKLLLETLAVAPGAPLSGQFGISNPERGAGAWTDGDVVLLPLSIGAAASLVSGKILGWPIPGLDLEASLYVYVVLEGEIVAVETSVTRTGENVEVFVNFRVPLQAGAAVRHGALVLKFLELAQLNVKETRKLGLLLKRMVFLSTADQDALKADAQPNAFGVA